MLTQPYVADACSGRFPKPRVFSENFHALLFPKDPLARSLASSLPPARVFVEGIDAYTLEEMTIFSSYLASIHGLCYTLLVRPPQPYILPTPKSLPYTQNPKKV